MPSGSVHYDRLDELTDELRQAPALIAKAIANTSRRHPRPVATRHDQIARINELIQAGALTDAALALVELELPQWTVHHLAYEHGTWACSLCKRRHAPATTDETADARHRALPLAILSAFLGAVLLQRRAPDPTATSARNATTAKPSPRPQ